MDKECEHFWNRLHIYTCKFQVIIAFWSFQTYRHINLLSKVVFFFFYSFVSLHWSLIIICHPGKVAYLRGMILTSSLAAIFTFCLKLVILLQTKLLMSHLWCRAFYTWILLEEAIEVWRIVLDGKLLEFKILMFKTGQFHFKVIETFKNPIMVFFMHGNIKFSDWVHSLTQSIVATEFVCLPIADMITRSFQ